MSIAMMLLRISRRLNIRQSLHNFFEMENEDCSTLQFLSKSPTVKPSSVSELSFVEGKGGLRSTVLENGITVVSEQTKEPGLVHFGIALRVGTRDESDYTSGALLSIKNTYYKTVLNTNETVNYGMVQMSGGKYRMHYDRQFSLFKAFCLPHDVVDIFSMVADCALEPRSVVAAQAAMKKNDHSHRLDNLLGGNKQFTDGLFKAAFGHDGLGRALLGNKGNVSNLSSFAIQKFQLENIHPSKIVVIGLGVDSHEQFLDLARDKLSYIQNHSGSSERVKTQYNGGEIRTITESGLATLSFGFEGAALGSPESFALAIAAQAIKGESRSAGSILSKALVDNVDSFNYSFSDSGLFGIKLTGAASKVEQLPSLAAQLCKPSFTEQEVARAVARVKRRVAQKIDHPFSRLELIARQQTLCGQSDLSILLQGLEKVTAQSVNAALSRSLASKLSFNARGGLVNRVASYDELSQGFKK